MVDCQEYKSSSLRKAKKQRIPKRGPGVAELEKILREQEKKDNNVHHVDKVSSSSISSLVPSSSLPNINHGNVNGGGSSKGVYIGGSGVYLPQQTLLPISWKDHEATTADFSFPMLVSNGSDDHNKMLQKNNLSMMDFFLSSSSTPSSTVGAYHHHHVEPPSNQKTYSSTLWHEEDKTMSTKRSRPNFPVENWRPAPPPPPPRMPCQPIRPQVSRLDPSSSSSNDGVFNLEISRDSMLTSPLDHGNPSGNCSRHLITLGSSTPSTQNCQPDLSKFIKQFPFQENTNGSLLQRSSTEPEASMYNKSFIRFLLQPEELQRGTSSEPTLCLKNEKRCNEKTSDFIDLDLKL